MVEELELFVVFLEEHFGHFVVLGKQSCDDVEFLPGEFGEFLVDLHAVFEGLVDAFDELDSFHPEHFSHLLFDLLKARWDLF